MIGGTTSQSEEDDKVPIKTRKSSSIGNSGCGAWCRKDPGKFLGLKAVNESSGDPCPSF